MSELSDRLNEARGDLSLDQVVELTQQKGQPLGRSSVARLLSGDHGPKVTDRVLQSIATALGLDIRELRMLASRPAGELEPFRPVQEANLLTRRQQAAINELIKSMVEGGTGSDSGQDEAEKSTRDATVTRLHPDQPGEAKEPRRTAARKTNYPVRPDQEHPDDD